MNDAEALDLLQCSSCFRGDVCPMLPCACAESIARAHSQAGSEDPFLDSQHNAQLEGLAIGLEQRGEKSAAHIIRLALKRLQSPPKSNDGPDWPPQFEMMKLEARPPGGGDWIPIFPAQLGWMAKEGNDVRAIEFPREEQR